MSDSALRSLNDITLAHSFSLEELLDSGALLEMMRTFEQLFAVPLRLYSSGGALLADAQAVPRFYAVLDKSKEGRRAVQQVINAVRSQQAQKGAPVYVPCPSGGRYLVAPVVHDGRLMGRFILGPFVDPAMAQPPAETVALVSDEHRAELQDAFLQLSRLSEDKASQLDAHVRATLDLLIFSGLKAYLASNMHMASVQESFRELQEKNTQLRQAYERLKELDRLKSNFLATVSHELRTPLTSIIGYSEMMLQGIAGDINEEQTEFLNTIHEKGEQLLELIKSLLDLSKLESGTMSLRRVMMDCGDLATQVVKTLTPSAMKRQVNLVAEVEPGLPQMLADGDRLRQVLNNLTENALKFTPKDGQVTVAVHKVMLAGEDLGGIGSALLGAAQRPAIEFRVKDTGIGIPEKERERVFDAFYQVDSSSTREVGGTGLGLSIVKRLVDAHDGEVHVEANQPHGAVFVVTLPILNRA